MQKSEEMFRKTFALSPIGISIYNLSKNLFVDCNPAFEKLTGYSRNEIVGKNSFEINFWKRPVDRQQIVEELLTNGCSKKEQLRITTKSGETKLVNASFVTVEINGETHSISNLLDETERIIAEEEIARQNMALFESQQKSSQLVQNLVQGIWIAQGPELHVVFATAEMKRITGYTPNELVSMSNKIVDKLIHFSDREAFLQRFVNRFGQELLKPDFEFRILRKNGETAWLQSWDKLVEYNGETGVQSSFLDITERKKAEMALQKSHLQLKTVNGKLQVIGSLTRHDVANKLMAAKGNTYLLKKKLANQPDLVKYVDAIDSELNQSARIFEFSRIYEKIGVEELVAVDLGERFNEATTLLRPSNSLKIVNECLGLKVTADSMLRQLFYTLIDNSLKHGKRVTVISLSYSKNKDSIHVFYEDNGIGIPEENKEKIFKEGFTTGGTGLGLKLVKKMVEAYGWSIEENGIPSKGARFKIAIPKSALSL